MPNTKENIFNNTDFGQFSQEMTDIVQDAVEKFWEKEKRIYFRSINDFEEIRKEKTISGIDFFSSKISVENHQPIIIRLSKSFVHYFLDSTLLYNSQPFKFKNLTPLELKILNSFCEFIYKKIKNKLIPVSQIKESDSKDIINLIFLVELSKNKNAYIAVSVPHARLNLKTITKTESFKDEDFLSSYTTVKLKAGTSKLTLEDLKKLAKDDIILLENSSVNKLILISGKIEQPFNVKVNSSLIFNINEDKSSNYEQISDEVIMENNLWDDIQIEVNAEFEKVKMTIGELKNISQGQVIDLGSVFDSEISLFVEDKKVAEGELLIINNRYAVKINKVITPEKSSKSDEITTLEQKPPSSPPVQPESQETLVASELLKDDDEEFDYSDFEK